jgi:hypothetical protein
MNGCAPNRTCEPDFFAAANADAFGADGHQLKELGKICRPCGFEFWLFLFRTNA